MAGDPRMPAIVRRDPKIPPSGLMTLKQMASYVGLSESYFSRRRFPDRPRETLIGTKLFFHIDDVEEWVRARRSVA